MFSKMRFNIAATACALAASLACTATAQVTDYWSSEAWYVGDYSNADGPKCGLGTQDFIEGRSPLTTFFFMAPESSFIAMKNSDWSITEGEHYRGLRTTFLDENGEVAAGYEDGNFIGGSQNQLMVLASLDVLDHVARNRTMTVARANSNGGSVVVGEVDLRGAAEGISQMRECFQKATARHQAALERERTHPKDPFAR